MVDTPFSKYTEASALTGEEIALISQLSTTITISGTTISAAAADNSYNDSGSGFVAAGFAVDDYVFVEGFTGDVANNIFSAKITALTSAKMTIGGTDDNVIVDDAAGETVTITKWVSARKPVSDFGGSSEWTLVDSDTASASSTVDLSVDTSTFNEWLLVGHDVVLSGANELALQLGSGGGPTWDTGNNYDFSAEWRYGTSGTGTHSRAFVSATANMRLGTVSSASSPSGISLDFECTLKYLASGKNARLINGDSSYDGTAGLTRILFDGVHLNAAYTTTGLRILPSAGTITSGKFLLYGRTR